MKTAIVNGRLIDPGLEIDGQFDIMFENGAILEVGAPGTLDTAGAEVHNAQGCWVLPGLTDLRVHVREPGQEYKEDIESASRAAAAGGFTAIVATASGPVTMDTPEMIEHVIRRGRAIGICSVEAATSITQRLEGHVLTEEATTKRAGAKIISEGAHCIANAQLMRSALEYATDFDLTVMTYPEEQALSADGHMHEGVMSTALGLKGIPRAAETTMVSRDIALAELTGGTLHISQLSCAESVELVRQARARGTKVSADVSPNHLVFTDNDLSDFDTNLKVRPPLREPSDKEALWAGLLDGTIGSIATGHAPQTILEKDHTFGAASSGALGLQTALSAVLTAAKGGPAEPSCVIKALSHGPATVLHGEYQGIAEGAPASLVVFNPQAEWNVKAADLVSKSKNSPFTSRPGALTGRVEKTFFDGRLVYSR